MVVVVVDGFIIDVDVVIGLVVGLKLKTISYLKKYLSIAILPWYHTTRIGGIFKLRCVKCSINATSRRIVGIALWKTRKTVSYLM